MHKKTKKILYILTYLLVLLTPLIILLIFRMPSERSFLRELSVTIGFLGMTMAGMQFLPVARLHFLGDALALDKIYKSHHALSLISVILIVLHPILLLINNPAIKALFNPITAPLQAQFGWIGVLGLVLIAVTSVWRKQIKLDYSAWLIMHDVFTVMIVVFGLLHIFRVNYHISDPAVRWVWIFEIALWSFLTIYIRLIKPLQLLKKPYQVKYLIEEKEGSWSLVLTPLGHAGDRFQPSQVAWLGIRRSPFSIEKNPFSYASSAVHPEEIRFAIKNLGNFTKTIGSLREGEKVYVDGPYGDIDFNSPLTQQGLVLLAGGIGIAPIMSILNTLADKGDQRPIYLYYGDYSKNTIIYEDELDQLRQRLDLQIFKVLEKSEEGYHEGYITGGLLEETLPENKTGLYYFICGPLPMIAAIDKILKNFGVPISQVTSEKYEMA